MHLHGRQSIAGLYDMLFRSIFLASNTAAIISGKRYVGKNVALVHARVEFHSPAGTMAGNHDALASLVMVRNDSQWRVTLLHNTLVQATS
jgi:uncharacterized protein (TIGR02246 family)